MVEARVRQAGADDIQDLVAIWACPGVARDTLGVPYDSPDRARRMQEGVAQGDHLLAAEVDGRVVGVLGLHRRRSRQAHIAGLGMGVHDAYQGQGIGTKLVEAAVDLADNWLNLKRVELHVYTDNARAIHLYQKFGFEIEGTHRAFAFRDGAYVDAYSMARVKE